jgi:hypothetical protein
MGVSVSTVTVMDALRAVRVTQMTVKFAMRMFVNVPSVTVRNCELAHVDSR